MAKNYHYLMPKAPEIYPDMISKDNDILTFDKVINDLAETFKEPSKPKKILKPKIIWEQDPVDPVTFIESPDYLDLKGIARDCVIDDLKNLFPNGSHRKLERKYTLAIFDEGIGSGKSFKMAVISVYLTYLLLCMYDPARNFKLAPRSKIAIMNMSVTGDQARRVVFGEIKNKIDQSPWFQEYYPPNPRVRSELQFDVPPDNPNKAIKGKIYKNIYIIPGSSSGMAPLGYNLFAAIMDEATLWRDTGNKDYAEDVFNIISRRITSRFGEQGLAILGGSPMYHDDFLERKIAEAKEIEAQGKDSKTLVVRRSHWEATMPNYKGPMFWFHISDSKIFETPEKLEKYREKVYRKALKKGGEENAKAAMEVFNQNIAEIPMPYYKDFKADPEKSKRDLGGWPSSSVNPFFEQPGIIEERCNLNRADPFNEYSREFKSWFGPIANAWHAIHIDSSKMHGGDATGLALGHNEGFTEDGGVKHFIDCVIRLQGTPEEPIPLEEIRQIIYFFTKLGFMIGKITIDGFESLDTIQLLTKKGYYVEYLSVDKNTKPYNELKNSIYENRIDYYWHKTFIEELQKVERVKSGISYKIDHPRGGSKDCSDAVAGCVYNLVEIAEWDPPAVDDEDDDEVYVF